MMKSSTIWITLNEKVHFSRNDVAIDIILEAKKKSSIFPTNSIFSTRVTIVIALPFSGHKPNQWNVYQKLNVSISFLQMLQFSSNTYAKSPDNSKASSHNQNLFIFLILCFIPLHFCEIPFKYHMNNPFTSLNLDLYII